MKIVCKACGKPAGMSNAPKCGWCGAPWITGSVARRNSE